VAFKRVYEVCRRKAGARNRRSESNRVRLSGSAGKLGREHAVEEEKAKEMADFKCEAKKGGRAKKIEW